MPGGLGGVSTNKSNARKSASLERLSNNGTIANNVSRRTVALNYLKPQTKTYKGGTEVAVKFRYRRAGRLGENTHVNAFNYYDRLTVQPTDTIKTGRETWCNLQNPITISHEEQIENSGEKEFDLLKANTEATMDDLAEDMNDVIWGVAGGDQSKLCTSIPTIISGAGTSQTIHGLAKSSNTWLNSQYEAAIGDAATNLFDAITRGYNSCVDNSPSKQDHLGLIMMAKTPYEALQKVLPAYVEYSSNKGVDIGFPSITYMGVPIHFDSTCPADSDGNYQVFGLTLKYWEMAVEKSMNFKTTEFYDMLPDQAADVAQLFHRWAIICSNPRTNWWGYGVTA